MFNDLVRIEVGTGEAKRTFETWRGVLSFYSGYFDGALNGRFRESAEGLVAIPSENPLIFDLFNHWAITRRFFESTLAPSTLFDYRTLAELWVFGDAHINPLLQNTVADILAEKMITTATVPDSDTIDYIYENTVPGSRLRYTIRRSIEDLHGFSANSYWRTMVPQGMDLEPGNPEDLKHMIAMRHWGELNVAAQNYCLSKACCERHIHDESSACPRAYEDNK